MANEAELLEGTETEAPEPSLRDTIADAIDQAEKPETPPPAPSEPPSPTPAALPSAGTPPSAEPSPQQPVTGAPSTTPPGVTPPVELKAPAQWKPAVREKWNALPRDIQEEIIRREGDSMRLIGSVGHKIRLADEVAEHLQPYMERLQQGGTTPSAFLGDVFSSIKSLALGSPQEKAEVVANIVQSYGVDLRTLDHMLTQRISAPPEVAQARRLAMQAQQVLQSQQSNLQHQTAMEAEKAIAAFKADPKHEFFDDVRDLMADLVESGKAQTLDDAYAAAIWANSDTRKILLQREAEARAAAKGQRAAAARRASSAVHGSPTQPGLGSQPNPSMSLRQTLEAAFDEHSNL